MSTFESQNSFFETFLDDYFAECDEHLMAIRQTLLAIETHLHQPHPTPIDRTHYATLLRSLHSIKGLSGMVNGRSTEQLVHQIESYVRQLEQARSPTKARLTTATIDLLVSSTNRLEQVIGCHRTGELEPEIESVMRQLAGEEDGETWGCGEEAVEREERGGETWRCGDAEIKEEREREEEQGQERIWCFEFVPSAVLAERGVDVNQVRDRLNRIGTITHAEPQITDTGNVVFRFRVTTSANEATFADWQQDGLAYRLFVPDQEPDTRGHEELSLPLPPSLIRVDLTKLDELMRLVGELVISRTRLEEQLARLAEQVPLVKLRGLQAVNGTLKQQIRQLREGVMRVRLVPIGEMFTRMHFVVRDLVKESQKQIQLNLEGQETAIDKVIVERMMDPLLHLVRNAVSHGIESPAERIAQGKPPQGTITLRAATAGEMVVIEVEEDGRGIEVDRITARAQNLGVLKANESWPNESLDSVQLLEVLCASGFSTQEQVDRVSGRGVGMAVVKAAVAELGGLLTLETHRSRGTRFTIQLPLTLAIADALIVSVGDHTFAIPQAALQAVIEAPQAETTRLENDEMLAYRGGILPILRLSRLFGLLSHPKPMSHVLVVGHGSNQVGIGVDRVLGQREIVVQPLTDPLVKIAGIAGAAKLGDRQTVLILDVSALVRTATLQSQPASNRSNAASLLVAQPRGLP